MDFFGKLLGKSFEGNEGKAVEIIIGEGSFLKDFEEGCINMHVGETKNVDVHIWSGVGDRHSCRRCEMALCTVYAWMARWAMWTTLPWGT